MQRVPNRAKTVFLQAIEKESAPERIAFLEGACGNDIALRQRVEELLKSFDDAGSFLDGAAVAGAAIVEPLDIVATLDMGPLAEGPGAMIGPYKLMEQIGEGGFGVVFVAEQTEPVRRRVALKLIKPGMDSRDVIGRFEAEREALALMDHPNIARVLDAGTTESGRPYFVMELVRGIPITEYSDQCQLSPRERLELFVPVCRAIQHAHQKGIIHRDVKPSNVLVTLHDGEPVVKVIDFGVAKALNQKLTQRTVYTSFAQMIGTPLYMSPEQAEISGLDVDTRSDIYSLGVLLYELLTGSTPFDRRRLAEAAFDEIRRIIREEEPLKPSTRVSKSGNRLASLSAQRKTEAGKLSRMMRGELDWIVMKALEKDRNRRYETANGFAADVLRYLGDEAVVACPPTAGYRLRKFARRNKTLLATSALVATALIVGTIVSTWQAMRASQAENRAKIAAAEASDNAQVARDNANRAQASEKNLRASEGALRERVYAADMNVVSAAYADGAIDRMNDVLEKHLASDQRGLEWFHWWRAGHLERAKARHPRTAYFSHMAVSPDGKTIALSGWPRHLFLYDSESLCLLRSPIQIKGQSSQTCFSPDSSFLVVDGVDGDWRSNGARVLNTKSWEVVATLETGQDNVMAFATEERLLAIASWGQIRLWTWDNSSWELQKQWSTNGKVEELALSPDGKVLIARMTSDLELNTRIDVWDVQEQKLIETIDDGQKYDSIALSPDGHVLAVGARGGEVHLWALASFTASDQPSPIGVLSTSGPISSLAYSPDAKYLVAGEYSNRELIVWRDKGVGFGPPITIRAHSRHVGFGSDPNTVYSTAEDGYLKVWDLLRCQPFDTIQAVDPDSQLGYADDNTLVYHDQDGTIQRWDVRAGEPLAALDKESEYYRITVADNGRYLAGVTADDELRVWDLADRRVIHPAKVESEKQSHLLVSPNGRRVAYTIRAEFGWGAVSLFDFGDATRSAGIPLGGSGGDSRVHFDSRPAFSPDSNQLAIQRGGFTRSNSHLLDITADSIEQRYQLEGWGRELCAAFSRDGSMLAIGSDNYDIRIHDAASGELKHILRGHTGAPQCLAFTQDGSRLVSAGFDSTVRIWKVGTSECRLLSTLHGHSGNIEFVTVSPNGTSFASVGADGTLLVWRTATVSEVEQMDDWRLDRARTVSELNDAPQIAPINLRGLLLSAQTHLATGEWDSAIADFDQALELVKNNQYLLQLRADARAQAGRLKESLEDWTQLIQLTDGANSEYLYRRGECYLMMGQPENARADFLQALSLGLTSLGHSANLLQQIESSRFLTQALVLNGAAWRYSTDRPYDDWNMNDFDDSSWRVGAAPFGTRIFCRMAWANSPDIWLRKTVEVDRDIESPLMLRVLADDRADVYLNGVFAAHLEGSQEAYKTVECAADAYLHRGQNTIAVHCLDEGWDAAVIDVGLYVQGDATTFGELLDAAEERNPNIRRVWTQHLVDQGRLEEAAEAIGKLVNRNPTDAIIRMQAAIIHAYNEDLDRFHELSRDALERFGETDVPEVAERVAKACLAAPPQEANLPAACQLADRTITLDPDNPWSQLVKALAEYRSGHEEAAVDWAEKCRDNSEGVHSCRAHAIGVLAMAEARLGNFDAAREAEAKLKSILQERSPFHTRAKILGNWHDWLLCEVFLREAQELLSSDRGIL